MVEKLDILLNSENYFEINEYNGWPLVSNSSLSWINPDQGGSPTKFLAWWKGQLDKPSSPSMKLGSMFHAWAENPDKFTVAPGNKPSDTLCAIAEYVYECIDKPVKTSLANHVDYIDEAAETIGYGLNWKQDTVRNKVIEQASDYFEFLKNSEGRHIFTPDEAERFEGMRNSVENSLYVMPIKLNPSGQCYREVAISFGYMGLPCKALIDMLEVDHELKTITVYDFKTSSKGASTFMSSSNWVDVGGNPELRHNPGPFTTYRYYRQMGFYTLAARSWATERGIEHYKINTIIYVIETNAPYEVDEYIISEKWIDIGIDQVQNMLIKVNMLCAQEKLGDF